jgi:hypothetical protein
VKLATRISPHIPTLQLITKPGVIYPGHIIQPAKNVTQIITPEPWIVCMPGQQQQGISMHLSALIAMDHTIFMPQTNLAH